MRGLEPLGSILLFIIAAVVFAYIYIGGFRALINSDLIQSAVIASFLAVLAHYVSRRNSSLATLAQPPDYRPSNLISATVLWTIYGSAFLIMAVDLFSRLNFTAPARLLTKMQIRFVGVSLSLVLLIIAAGIGFGLALSTEIGSLQSASDYYRTVVTFFTNADATSVQVIFLVGLFCMIFTTIDTLLLTVMQIRFYSKGIGSRRGDLSKVLVLAVGCSVIVDVDAVCAFGIFVGSILMLPCMQVLSQLFPRIPFTPAFSHRYLWFSLAISTAFVVTFNDVFMENFDIHYAIPGIVILATLTCGLIAALSERLLKRDNL